jgi:hypothetical protein
MSEKITCVVGKRLVLDESKVQSLSPNEHVPADAQAPMLVIDVHIGAATAWPQPSASALPATIAARVLRMLFAFPRSLQEVQRSLSSNRAEIHKLFNIK